MPDADFNAVEAEEIDPKGLLEIFWLELDDDDGNSCCFDLEAEEVELLASRWLFWKLFCLDDVKEDVEGWLLIVADFVTLLKVGDKQEVEGWSSDRANLAALVGFIPSFESRRLLKESLKTISFGCSFKGNFSW